MAGRLLALSTPLCSTGQMRWRVNCTFRRPFSGFNLPFPLIYIHYYFFNGYEEAIRRNKGDPSLLVRFPGLPLMLSNSELPSILISEKHRRYALEFEELFETLGKETKTNILLNTFNALEHEAITAMGDEKVNLIPIGPLNQSATKSDHYKEEIEWLNLQPVSSVVYVSFGSISILPKNQMEELARGLLDSEHPFLWVIRANKNREEEEIKMSSAMDEAMKKGKVVAWCSQVDVLNHPSMGCFVTHCGWNSTMETLVAGVLVVAFPQLADQCLNVKMMEDVWKVGVKAKANGDGMVDRREIMRCLEKVMGSGERGVEVRENAKKWKALAREAAR